jgi:hypothetical protein
MDLPPNLHWWTVLVGFVVAIAGGHLGTRLAVYRMEFPPPPARASDNKNVVVGPETPEFAHNNALGLVERAIYASAVLFGQFGAIGLWVGLKVARDLREDRSRAAFNRWLTGTGLSLGYGVAGGWLATTPADAAEWRVWPVFLVVAVGGVIAINYRLPEKLRFLDWPSDPKPNP